MLVHGSYLRRRCERKENCNDVVGMFWEMFVWWENVDESVMW